MRDTIDMASEAGGRAQQNKNCDVEYLMSNDALKAFEALVRADERSVERGKFAVLCNELALEAAKAGFLPAVSSTLNILAGKIRARGNT
jgi:hypothetical protein